MKQTLRALALLLALLLTGAAALSEAATQPVEPDVASVELALGEEALSNDSQIDPEYEPSSYEISLEEAGGRIEFFSGDHLNIYSSDNYIVSCVSSDPDVAYVYLLMPNCAALNFEDPGKANITIKAQDGRSFVINTILNPNIDNSAASFSLCLR